MARPPALRIELLRRMQQPQRAAKRRIHGRSPAIAIANYRRERGLRHAPGVLGPVFRHAADAVHRVGAEARAQMLDERRHLARRRVAALARRPQRLARERRARVSAPPRNSQRRTGSGNTRLARRSRSSDCEPRGIRLGRGQPQRARRRRRAVVMETALQRGDAALPRCAGIARARPARAAAPRGCARDLRFHDRDRRAP